MTGEPVPGDHYLWHWGDGPAIEAVAKHPAVGFPWPDGAWWFDVGSTDTTPRLRCIALDQVSDPNDD